MKIVIVLDRKLPVGLLANTAAALALSAAKSLPDAIGPDICDADGTIHPGITKIPIPILGVDREELRKIRMQAIEAGDINYIDFSDVAQRSARYEKYTELLGRTNEADLTYLGLCIYGVDSSVNRITGSIPLLR
ncbi:MAG: DUF2000 domain-containing protein [Bacillota bacterium]|nr:DUF2000 domain-containing protein [Bacillota bacterium]